MLYFQNYFLICWKHKIIFILFIYFLNKSSMSYRKSRHGKLLNYY